MPAVFAGVIVQGHIYSVPAECDVASIARKYRNEHRRLQPRHFPPVTDLAILFRFMMSKAYERAVLSACGLSLLLLVVATEKAFPALDAPRDAARDPHAANQPLQNANKSDDEKSPRPNVTLGPIYPDLLGRSVCESVSHSTADRVRRGDGSLALTDWPSFLIAQNVAPIAAIHAASPTFFVVIATRPEPSRASFVNAAGTEIRHSIVRTGPPAVIPGA